MAIPGKQAVWSGLTVLLSFCVILPVGSARAAEDAPPASESRLQIRQFSPESGAKAIIKTDIPASPSASRPVSFQAELLAIEDLGELDTNFEILDESGETVADVTIRTTALAGSTPLQFTWDARTHPDGKYTGLIEIEGALGNIYARQRFVLTKRSKAGVDAALESARDALEYLYSFEIQVGRESPGAGRLEIAKAALRRADEKREDWFASYDLADYVLKATDRIRARWSFSTGSAGSGGPTIPRALAGLKLADGGLRVQETPVFLGGLAASAEIENLARTSKFGLNFMVVDAGAPSELPGLVTHAAEENIALLAFIDTTTVSPIDFTALSDIPSSKSALLALALSNLRPVDIKSPSVRDGFIKLVGRTYKDRYELNRMWKKRFKDFDEVDVWPDYKNYAYQFDWQTYHWALNSRIALESVKQFRGSGLDLPITLAIDDPLLATGSAGKGIDSETINRALDIGLLTTSSLLGDPIFGIRYPAPVMLQALRRSLAPDTPLVQVHRVEVSGLDSVYERDMTKDIAAFVWESAIEGVSGLALDLHELKEVEDLPAAIEFQALEGLHDATQDINRLVEIVEAFRRDEAVVAILWSDSSRILDKGVEHLPSLRRAYEGTSFGGHKLRFLSERQLEAGDVEGIQLLVLPHTPSLSKEAFRALQKLLDSGVNLIRSVTSIPYDSRGRSQDDMIVYGPNTVLVRGDDVSTEYMEGMDAVISRGRLPDIPRAVNPFGFPIEGIKTRYVEEDGEDFLYLINLRKESVTCALSVGPVSGWDLIGEREVEFPRRMESLRPMLVRLNKPELSGAEQDT